MNPASCLFESRLHWILSSYWLAHFYLMKNPPKCCYILVWIADVGILYSRAVIQRTIDVSPAFLEHSSAEKIAVWAFANHDPNKQEVGLIFLMKRLRTKIKNKKSKTYSGWCPFQWYHSHTDRIWPDDTSKFLSPTVLVNFVPPPRPARTTIFNKGERVPSWCVCLLRGNPEGGP